MRTGDRITLQPGVVEPVYFGCWGGIGHYFRGVGGTDVEYERGRGGTAAVHRRPPTPWGYGVENLAPHSTVQGAALLHHKDGWTALAIDDFTVDHRGNSKSVFCFPEILDFDQASAKARELFPRIAKRLGSWELVPT